MLPSGIDQRRRDQSDTRPRQPPLLGALPLLSSSSATTRLDKRRRVEADGYSRHGRKPGAAGVVDDGLGIKSSPDQAGGPLVGCRLDLIFEPSREQPH